VKIAAALVLLTACSSGTPGGFGPASGPADAMASAPPDDASEPAASDDEDASTAVFASDAAGSSSCTPGVYGGTYQGTNDSSKLGGPKDFPISGPMAITLVRSSEQRGELLTVSNDATFDATWGGFSTGDAASGIIVIHSTLAGQLDCNSDAFTANSTDASWTILTIPAGMATVQFTGTYDASSARIGGTFVITSAIATSTGTWSVTLEPAAGDP
jgi:hypothetical protein